MKRRPYRWSELSDEYLLAKAAEGMPFRAIASAIGVTCGSAWSRYVRLCASLGKSPYRISRKEHDEQTRAKVVSMLSKGATVSEVARSTGLRVNQVRGLWNTWKGRNQFRRAA